MSYYRIWKVSRESPSMQSLDKVRIRSSDSRKKMRKILEHLVWFSSPSEYHSVIWNFRIFSKRTLIYLFFHHLRLKPYHDIILILRAMMTSSSSQKFSGLRKNHEFQVWLLDEEQTVFLLLIGMKVSSSGIVMLDIANPMRAKEKRQSSFIVERWARHLRFHSISTIAYRHSCLGSDFLGLWVVHVSEMLDVLG